MKINFTEFCGDNDLHIAANSTEEGFSSEDPFLHNLLVNDNKKIIFICYDPTEKRGFHWNIGEKVQMYVFQSDIMECLVSLMSKDTSFCNKLIGLHAIITKSDMWYDGHDVSLINKVIEENNFTESINGLKDLSLRYGLGPLSIMPYSIGRFMIGDTYTFDDTDAKHLLGLISSDINRHLQNTPHTVRNWIKKKRSNP